MFQVIAGAGLRLHPAYAENDRMSCVFCVMARKEDIQHGARQRPELLAEYAALEELTGYTMHMSRIPILELAS